MGKQAHLSDWLPPPLLQQYYWSFTSWAQPLCPRPRHGGSLRPAPRRQAPGIRDALAPPPPRPGKGHGRGLDLPRRNRHCGGSRHSRDSSHYFPGGKLRPGVSRAYQVMRGATIEFWLARYTEIVPANPCGTRLRTAWPGQAMLWDRPYLA